MAVTAGDILRTSMNFILNDGTQYQNIYHHERTGVAVMTDAAIVSSMADQFELMYDALAPLVKTNVVEDLSFVDEVQFIEGQWQVTENIGTFTIAWNPTEGTDALPNQCSPFVIFKTARPKTVGRKFLFPLTEASQAGSFLTPGAVLAIVAYADEVLTPVPLQALNTMQPGVVRTGVDLFLPTSIAVVTNVIGTQRRRRPGVGA